ncbi:MAG: hypothetical protein OXR03_15360, partial [Rhodospirillaceae bacterium]|nr:hypothetical protein [Rhodospirillaceae bacterium]
AGKQDDVNREGLRVLAEELSRAARDALSNMKLIGDAFAQQSTGLTGASDQVASRLNELSDAYRQQAEDVETVSEKATRQLRDTMSELAKQGPAMTSAASQARTTFEGVAEKVQSGSRDVLESLDEAIAKANDIGKTFDRQSARLTQASADASEQARRLAQEELVLRRDLFLKTARFIIEDLDSTSIDLTRILYNDVSEADWKRYVKGDRGVFTRSLLRGKQASLAARVTEKIKTNQEMRDYVVRYVDQFDRLLNEAQDSDPENLLHSTFMTADVGKLYILLCRALGREE